MSPTPRSATTARTRSSRGGSRGSSAWRRTTIPGVNREDGAADIRRYELRTPEVTIKRRTAEGRIEYEVLRGPRPRAVIAFRP